MSKRFKVHSARPAKVAPLGSGGAKAKPARHAKLGNGPGTGPAAQDSGRPKEIGGPDGPEPTRYGDWEIKGRCIDF